MAGANSTIITLFDSIEAPGINIKDYLLRIHKYASCSDACYIYAFIYIDRMINNNSNLVINNYNVHRIILAAILIAIKFLDDSYGNNVIYSKIGGIQLAELNSLEIE